MWLLERQPIRTLRTKAALPGADPHVGYVLGRILARRHDYRGAAEAFQRSDQLLDQRDDPELRQRVEGELALALVHFRPPDETTRLVRPLLERDPGNVPAHRALGTIFMQRQQYELATKEFRIVTILDPKGAEGWYELGRAQNLNRHPEEAEPLLRKALALHPNESRFLRELGDSFGYRSRFAEAQACFERAVAANPTDRDALAALARSRVLQARTPEQYREARKALLPFATEGAGDPFFLGQLGVLDVQFGELADAEKHLKRAVELKPDHAEATYNLAMVYQREGRDAEAEQVMRRFRRIETLYRKVNEYRKRITMYPEDVDLNLGLARTLEAQGNLGEAFGQFQYSLHHFPGNDQVRTALAAFTNRHRSELARQLSPAP